jgi:hypothetical protein
MTSTEDKSMIRSRRRDFLKRAAAAGIAAAGASAAAAIAPGERPERAGDVAVLNPGDRVPLSFFIDDSTCLVNMGHFCMPQFAEAWPDSAEYRRPWRSWPREIPDAFVREFGEFCAEHDVRGKYSVVPYPACVGWLDRELPGWSRRELLDSLALVRDLIAPRFDIHPEMISHTRIIDLATGRPRAEISAATMENSYPCGKKSVDELASYLAYALRILGNCGLACEGITTPGGFGNGVNSELSLAVQQAVGDVFKAEIPHYFKYVSEAAESTRPVLEHVRGLTSDAPRVTVNVPAATGDWFGGWDGNEPPRGHRYATDDAAGGRMVELIERGEPAVMLCHWPGLYSHGTKRGLEAFKRVVLALEGRFAHRTRWMTISAMARYAAARELTRVARDGATISLTAPFACPDFTLRAARPTGAPPVLSCGGRPVVLEEARAARDLAPGRFLRAEDGLRVCFDLPKGLSTLAV